jgi:transposase InsO family protein
LKNKNKMFEQFRSLTLRLNNKHPNCLKVIHSDNETEFRNVSFNQFCLEHSVDKQFSAPRIPQRNGVMKQKNYIIFEMARTILDEHRTLQRFWADAISTACYISNQIFKGLEKTTRGG